MDQPRLVLGVREWYHGTTLPRAENILSAGIDPLYRVNQDRVWDFCQGFYMTSRLEQAREFALYMQTLTGHPPAVLAYRVSPVFWHGLFGTEFPLSDSGPWRRRIKTCRTLHGARSEGDFTYGPVADNIPRMVKYTEEPTIQYQNRLPRDQVAFHSLLAAQRLNQAAAEGECSLWLYAASNGWHRAVVPKIKIV